MESGEDAFGSGGEVDFRYAGDSEAEVLRVAKVELVESVEGVSEVAGDDASGGSVGHHSAEGGEAAVGGGEVFEFVSDAGERSGHDAGIEEDAFERDAARGPFIDESALRDSYVAVDDFVHFGDDSAGGVDAKTLSDAAG